MKERSTPGRGSPPRPPESRGGGDYPGSPAGVLEARAVTMGFNGAKVLRETSLAINERGIFGVVGPNGAGKTTLFNVLAGLYKPWSGRVLLHGRDVTDLPPAARARLGLARTFQLSRELWSLTVLENLLLAAPDVPGESLLKTLLAPAAVRRAERASAERAMGLLERVGLADWADQPAGALSGGQKKLLELCRALAREPKVVLLDEPAAGVNPSLLIELAGYLKSLRGDGQTFVVVEHNMDMVAALCDRVYVMVEGSVVAEGSLAAVAADNMVRDAYFGGGLGI